MNHLSAENIEALATGTLPAGSDEVRRHVAECASCADRLEREAQLEVLLHAAAEGSSARLRKTWRSGLQVAAGLLILVGGSLWILNARRTVPSRLEQPPVVERRVASMPLGRNVESPRDLGRWAEPYVPGLEQGTTTGQRLNDSL